MPVPAYPPTDEQRQAISLFMSGENVTIEALAGTGKTSTLQYIAGAAGRRRGLYIAFNKAIQVEAAQKFAGTGVVAKTTHALAYGGFALKHRLKKAPPMQWSEKARILGITTKFSFSHDSGALQAALSIQRLVGMTTETIKRFQRSASVEITDDLVPIPDDIGLVKLEEAVRLRAAVVTYARRAWEDLSRPDGRLPYTHDTYLKAWQLSQPHLAYDFILLDEAQDTNPVVTDVLARQTHAQVITVGDRYQSIYGWRGAEGAMDTFGGKRTALTQSFRFGQAIADYANRWLELMGADLRLRGHAGASSVFRAERRTPDAILTRTNAQAISEIAEMQEKGHTTGIAGEHKARELHDLARAALSLQERGHTSHPELSTFNTWGDVVTYAESDEGADMKPLVDVVEKFGAGKVLDLIDSCIPVTDNPDVTVSTAHVAKGLEWFQVRIAEDFREPQRRRGAIQPIPAEEARLIYVAATRAQRHLDARGLDWLEGYLEAGGWVDGGPLSTPVGAVHVDVERAAGAPEREEAHHDEPARA